MTNEHTAALNANREYQRRWRAENKDKVKGYQQKYWERKGKEHLESLKSNDAKENGGANDMFDAVLRTNDYEIFKHMTGNRDVSEMRIRKIAESINKNGYIFNPIICNEKMEVIDGQGRLETLKRLNLPVDYIIHPGLDVKDCIAMNAYQTQWATTDYIESHAKIGNESYVRLKKLIEEFNDFPIRVCVSACLETIGADLKSVQDGTFICTKERYLQARELLQYASMFTRAMHQCKKGNDTWLYTAIMFVREHVPECDCEKLLVKFEKYYNSDVAQNFVNVASAIKVLNAIYNFRSHYAIYLDAEYDKYCRKMNASYEIRWSEHNRIKSVERR